MKLPSLIFNNEESINMDIHFPISTFSHISINKQLLERYFGSIDLFRRNISEKFIQEINVKKTFVDITLSSSFFDYCILNWMPEKIELPHPINLEYCSANPSGKLHVGNMRNIVVGECIKKFFKFSNINYCSEYYLNDMGNQIESLLNILENNIPNEYSESISMLKSRNDILNADDISEFFSSVINQQLRKMSIQFDIWTSEKEIERKYRTNDEFWNSLNPIIQIEKETNRKFIFNDVRKCFLLKENMQSTYLLRDLMYMYDKKKRGFKDQILVLGFDHDEYLRSIQLYAKSININLTHIQTQHIYALVDKQPVGFSKRNGICNDPLDYEIESLFESISSHDNKKFIYFDVNNHEKSQYGHDITVKSVENRGTMDENIILLLFKFNNAYHKFSSSFEPSLFFNILKDLYKYLQYNVAVGTLNKNLCEKINIVFEFLTDAVCHRRSKIICIA